MEIKMHTIKNEIYKSTLYGDIIKIFYVLDGIEFGVDSNSNWLQLMDDNKHISILENSVILGDVNDSILVLLEINIKKFKEDLNGALMFNNVSSILAETFPYELIVINGLYSESDWWITLALDWLTDMPINNQYNYELIIASVDKIKNDKAYNQNIRHKANRVIIKYK